jgi:hypothetical protein
MAQKLAESDALYDRYVKPLEAEHMGEYAAVSATGKTVLASELMDVVDQAVDELGPESSVFRVGERAVGRWR